MASDQWHVELFTASTVCAGEFTAGLVALARSFPCAPMGLFAVSIVSVFCVPLFLRGKQSCSGGTPHKQRIGAGEACGHAAWWQRSRKSVRVNGYQSSGQRAGM